MGYQVKSGGITRELNKEPSLHCSSIYIIYMWSVLQQYYSCSNVYASSSCPITHPHVFFLRLPYFLHVPWHHIFNLRYTCAHHIYTMRNLCPLTSLLTLNPSKLFPILLDPKSFQTALDSVTWLPDHVLSIHCRLIIYYCSISVLTLTLPKVCLHTRLITPYFYNNRPHAQNLYTQNIFSLPSLSIYSPLSFFSTFSVVSTLSLLFSLLVLLFLLPFSILHLLSFFLLLPTFHFISFVLPPPIFPYTLFFLVLSPLVFFFASFSFLLPLLATPLFDFIILTSSHYFPLSPSLF